MSIEPDAYWEEAHAAFHRLSEADARIWNEPDPPFAVDPLNPTDAELAAAIERGLADGTLIDADDWLAREAEAEEELDL